MIYVLNNEYIPLEETSGTIMNVGNTVIEINTTTNKNEGILLIPGEYQCFTKSPVYVRSVESYGKITVNDFIEDESSSEMTLEDIIVKSSNTEQTIQPSAGYDAISQVTVEPLVLEDVTVSSLQSTNKTITASAGNDALNSVTIDTDAYNFLLTLTL